MAINGVTGFVTAPEGRVCRQRNEGRERRCKEGDDSHSLVAGTHADVYVGAERDLRMCKVTDVLFYALVAGQWRNQCQPAAKRVRPGPTGFHVQFPASL